jgi:hypothetical protein
VQRVELLALRIARVELGLNVERLNQRVRVEEQLQDRIQQPPEEPDDAAVRFEERGILEREIRRRRQGGLGAAELLQQVRPHAARIEELLELDVRQLPDFLLRVVDAALLPDARADLPHDLLDIDVVGTNCEVRHKETSNFDL